MSARRGGRRYIPIGDIRSVRRKADLSNRRECATVVSVEATPLPASALTALTFLAGHWRSEGGNFVIEEIWLPPSAGVAQGMVRLIKDGQVGTIELIVAAAENDRVILRYNHFHSNYQTWESDGPIELTLTSAREDETVFSNLQRPARHAMEMGYRLTSAQTLRSWVMPIDPNGSTSRVSFDYQKVR